MSFTNATLLRMPTEAGRTTMLDQVALAQMAEAGFDLTLDPLQGPYALAVEGTDLGIEVSPPVTLEAMAHLPGAPTPTELRGTIHGLRGAAPLRAEGMWRAEIIARRVPQDSVIETALPAFAAPDLDRAIIAAQGALPAAPAALEAARRQELIARIGAAMTRPALFDDAALQRLLDAAGQPDVAGLLATRGGTSLGAVRLRFSAPPAGPPVPVRLPVTILVLVRDAVPPLAAFLSEARALREHLSRDAALLPPPAPLRRRAQLLPLLVVPAATFDTPGFPGADPAQRRAAAGEFLAREAIGLALSPP